MLATPSEYLVESEKGACLRAQACPPILTSGESERGACLVRCPQQCPSVATAEAALQQWWAAQ